MQPDEVTITAWGFLINLEVDEYGGHTESIPIALELADDALWVTEFRHLRSLEEAVTALQETREGKLGVRQYETTKTPLSAIAQIVLKPYKPAEPVCVPGSLKQKLRVRISGQGKIWIANNQIAYPKEQEPAFTAIYQAIERAIDARSSQPKSLPLSYGPGVPRRGEAQTPSDAPPQTSASTSGPDTSNPDMSGPDASDPDMSGSCPHCGQPTAPAANFCPACGGQIKTLCPSCQHQIKAGDNFCPNCGERVTPALAN